MNEKGPGVLYIIATPIGNLKDITFRAVETLQQADYLLCEDTRQTLKLLNRYNIKKHLESYFVGNEIRKAEAVVRDLLSGKDVGLVTDGGTPCISDPGNHLVRVCREKGIRVVPVPGPSALAAALSVSGFGDKVSVFIGFLPKSRKKINKTMEKIRNYEGNIILYESPYRLKSLLSLILKNFGNVRVMLFKELTKVFESIKLGHIKEILDGLGEAEVKGEYVVIFNREID
jgi:16S rRNA (cytidine1402-2'-O)-methyltransferase